ncbi:MAG: LuxR C-terminal-related transcriptional regulator [Candidatus Omnitrophica bacterium]|nr:LuxR C-terminal-related transcriptional regulator [Candidatus Omnitrophota bacterium]
MGFGNKKKDKKTRKQLITEIELLEKKLSLSQNADCRQDDRVYLEREKRLSRSLRERVKELNCFYELFKLAESSEISLSDILSKAVNLLPQSWQYSDITCARILLRGREFKTTNFRKTKWRQFAEMKIFNKTAGCVEVFYLKKKSLEDEGPFLKEERSLINSIAQWLGEIVERKTIEGSLKQSEAKLREQNLSLEQKNIALREIVAQIEVEKNKLKKDIMSNLNWIIFPILEKLKVKNDNDKYIELLRAQLKELTSSFGYEITKTSIKLTPREIEICNMIKASIGTKGIASLLNISPQTVEKHRKNIRKKLKLPSKKPNLAYFFHQL